MVYHEQSEQLKGFYKNKGICMEIDGTLPLPTITERIVTSLKQADESV
ncbi:hypothetical protein SDC9_118171 [bioreactor metagenome]|uniref:Adenylate kinase n=1 Tax=bioreactor metagenome TaxID=1076179 RepID=A0A645C1K1_9ZZZZ